MTKKILAIMIAVMIALSTVVVGYAAETPTITVSSVTAAPGDTVTLDVALANNPGINTFSFGFDYDETRLSLTNVKLASGIPGQFTYSKKAVWLNSEDITTNGSFLTLTFDVLDEAPIGDANVAVTYNTGDISNYNEEDVGFQTVNGQVKVVTDGDDYGEITVGAVTGAPGEIVKVPVSLTKNPGINTFSLGFDYDTSMLKLTDVTVSENLGGQFTYAKKAVWLNSKDTTYTGEILTLTFEILETALDGEARINVTYNTGDISNYDEEDLYFEVVKGEVTIQTAAVYDTRVSLGKVTGRPGETVNVYVSLDKDTDVKSMSIYDVTYDTDKLTLAKGEWVIEDSIIDDWNQEDETGVITYKENTNLYGRVFLLTFEIKENLEDALVEIGCAFKVTAQNTSGIEEELSVEIVPGSVNILNILRGDVNGDNFVDSNDAIHLLYHTLLPERYEINQNGDFDGDSYVNSNDAIHLLYYTLLPERYPLA